jgi:mannose-6-phosphate isomerase-like protein (cupin superfamily)
MKTRTPVLMKAASNDALDGVVAAPKHHRLLFENDRVRVIESRIRVGERTPPHTHLHQRVMYTVSGSSFVRRDEGGRVIEAPLVRDGSTDEPRVMWAGPTDLHTIENTGSDDLVVIAVEVRCDE